MNARRFPPIETRHGTLDWNERTQIMAIINLTPDSFSGDGIDGQVELAVQKALQAEADGATILDLGAESTRPGHQPDFRKRRNRTAAPGAQGHPGRLVASHFGRHLESDGRASCA